MLLDRNKLSRGWRALTEAHMRSLLIWAVLPASGITAVIRWLLITINVPTLIIIFGILVIIGVLFLIFISRNETPDENGYSAGWSAFSILLTVMLLASLVIERTSPPSTFAEGWPDAVRCYYKLPGDANQSPMIWYYRGISKSRYHIGDVATYFLVGWYNSDHLPAIPDDSDFPKSLTRN